MSDFPLHMLFIILVSLILLSAFFSGTETGMMSINRYRLRHRVRKGDKAAKRLSYLLERPDRLLAVILIGNNFANIVASSIATIIAIHLYGTAGVLLAAILLTIVILIFAEVAPKTLGALYPEKIAHIAAWPIRLLLTALYPVVWLVNIVANNFLRLFRIKVGKRKIEQLTRDELRTVVRGASDKLYDHQSMMLGILDLEKVAVEDIMIPRNEVAGVDIEQDWTTVVKQLTAEEHVRLPLYRGEVNNIIGMLHMRDVFKLLLNNQLNKQSLTDIAEPAHFIPEGTPLNVQLNNFRNDRRRIGFIVDEYGDVMGLLTLEDILEEIVGEYTTTLYSIEHDVAPQKDGSYLVDGSANLRDLNRLMKWNFPTNGPKTLSGLIIEYLEAIPKINEKIIINNYQIQILALDGNMIKSTKVWVPKLSNQ